MSAGLIFALVCAVLAIVYGAWQSMRIMRLPEGNERMREISAAVREGAIAYLWRQYKTIAIVGLVPGGPPGWVFFRGGGPAGGRTPGGKNFGPGPSCPPPAPPGAAKTGFL